MTHIRCSICKHPSRKAIDQALTSGASLLRIAVAFDISKSALHRHQHRCGGRTVAVLAGVSIDCHGPSTARHTDLSILNLPPALLDAMEPIGSESGDDVLMLETKLRHLNAIYAYALSRAVAQDDVASILRGGRAIQKLFQLDLLTASQRLAYRAQSQIDPTMRLLGQLLDEESSKPTEIGTKVFATRCNGARYSVSNHLLRRRAA